MVNFGRPSWPRPLTYEKSFNNFSSSMCLVYTIQIWSWSDQKPGRSSFKCEPYNRENQNFNVNLRTSCSEFPWQLYIFGKVLAWWLCPKNFVHFGVNEKLVKFGRGCWPRPLTYEKSFNNFSSSMCLVYTIQIWSWSDKNPRRSSFKYVAKMRLLALICELPVRNWWWS